MAQLIRFPSKWELGAKAWSVVLVNEEVNTFFLKGHPPLLSQVSSNDHWGFNCIYILHCFLSLKGISFGDGCPSAPTVWLSFWYHVNVYLALLYRDLNLTFHKIYWALTTWEHETRVYNSQHVFFLSLLKGFSSIVLHDQRLLH